MLDDRIIAHIERESTHGIWLLVGERKFFLFYEDFPWFKEIPVENILRVEQPTPGHFYWPDLDVDLGIESIEHPEKFPLKAKVSQERG